MAETIEQFVVRRRGELDAEVGRLEAQIRAVEAERERVDKVAGMLALETPLFDDPNSAMPGQAMPNAFAPGGGRPRSPKRVSEATIKELVIDILMDNQGSGMTALDILAGINDRVDVEYPRTSLSPQLSRLKAEGKLHREGFLWVLGGGPDVVDAQGRDPNYWLNKPDQPETDTEKAPTEAEAL